MPTLEHALAAKAEGEGAGIDDALRASGWNAAQEKVLGTLREQDEREGAKLGKLVEEAEEEGEEEEDDEAAEAEAAAAAAAALAAAGLREGATQKEKNEALFGASQNGEMGKLEAAIAAGAEVDWHHPDLVSELSELE